MATRFKGMRPSEFAEYLGTSRPYVSKLKKQGRLIYADDGLIDAEATAERLRATRDLAQTREEAALAAVSPDYAAARARRESAVAEREEIRLAQQRAGLVRAADVHAAAREAHKIITARLAALPDAVDDIELKARLRAAAAQLADDTARHFARAVHGGGDADGAAGAVDDLRNEKVSV